METWSYRIILVAGMVALAVGVRSWLFEPEPVVVKVVRAEMGRVEETITNSRAGTVKARQRGHLSAEVGGRVVALPFDKGDTVNTGDVLLRLNDASERAKLERTKRDLVVMRAERNRSCLAAERAKREHARFLDLSDKELVSVDELDRVASTASTTAARAMQPQLVSIEPKPPFKKPKPSSTRPSSGLHFPEFLQMSK